MELGTWDFWSGFLSIFLINIVLSGDNAVVIAMVSRRLPVHQQKSAIILGCLAAIGMRIVLVLVAVYLLQVPLMQLAGGLLLIWIALSLANDNKEIDAVQVPDNLWQAIKTIILADFIMSLDNVLAIAGLAGDNYLLLILGLLTSMPLIAFGSNVLLKLMERCSLVVLVGVAILGYTAGNMITSDSIISGYLPQGIFATVLSVVLAAVIVAIVVLRQKDREK